MDPALREIMARQAPAGEMEAIVKLAKPGIPPKDARVVSQFGDIATCRLQVGDIEEVWSDEVVVSLKAPRPVGMEPAFHGFEEVGEGAFPGSNPTTFTGRGTVVGIVDWGFDFTHPNFLNPDGSTRFLAIWDQTAPAHPSASKYGYGKIHHRQQINEALKTEKPFETLGYHPASGDPDDSGSHGTHVTDIAAGNGTVGNMGMAPEAALVGVHLSAGKTGGLATLGDSVRILEAIDFIGKEAGERPLVINLSVGKHGGSHQGNSLVEQGLDNFLKEKPGRALVNSAGNYFSAHIHAAGRVVPGGFSHLDWEVDKNDRTPNELEIWYPRRDNFRLKIEVPGLHSNSNSTSNSTSNSKVEMPALEVALGGEQDIIVNGKIVGRAYHRANEPNTGDHHIDIFLYKNAPKGTWRLALEGVDVVDGRWHAWIERDGGCRSCQSKFQAQHADPGFTTGSICNGLYTIAVGAYDPRDPLRQATIFSSAGPTADGRKKPNLLAPGMAVRAARSAPAEAARSQGGMTVKSGTSMAAPHVTGAVALLFEAVGRLLPIEATRRLLLSSLDPPPKEAGQAFQYGEGYLNVGALTRAGYTYSSHQKSTDMKDTYDFFQTENEDELTPYDENEDLDELESVADTNDYYRPWEEDEQARPEDGEDIEEEETEDDMFAGGADNWEENKEESDEEDYEEVDEEDYEEEEEMAEEGNGKSLGENDYASWYDSEKKPCVCHEKTEEAEEHQHQGQHWDCRECGEFLVEQAEAWMGAGAAENFMEGFFSGKTNLSEGFSPSRNGSNRAKRMFDSIAFGKSTLPGESWEEEMQVVASPKSRLANSLLPGDIVLSRAFGDGNTWQSLALNGELYSREQAVARGLSPDSGKQGIYLEVATVQPMLRHPGEGFAKRIGDEWGRLSPDCMVVRARPVDTGWDDRYPSESTPKLKEQNAIKENRLQAVKQKWEPHRQEIYKFLGLGVSPDEGAFARAIFDWQIANGFTGDGVDGVLGKNTWKKLKKAAGILSPPPVSLSGPLDRILEVAYNSDIKDYPWKERGVPKPAYIMGMALAYARVYCKYKAGDAAAKEMGKADTGDTKKDALALFAKQFKDAGMANDVDGVDTLRHLFVLLTGLGMRESSGKHCTGMYHGDQNTKADTAEAGLFQTSYNIRNFFSAANKIFFDALFVHYQNNRSSGFLDVFKWGVSCKASDAKNYGTGNGAIFQELSKTCPAFSVESTALGLRAGSTNHWAPIRDKVTEIRKECDEMLQEVQRVVDAQGLCPLLLPTAPGALESFSMWETTPAPVCKKHQCWVQETLNQLAGAGLVVNGKEDAATKKAVTDFQSKNNLTPNGKTDPATERTLLEQAALSKQLASSAALRHGSAAQIVGQAAARIIDRTGMAPLRKCAERVEKEKDKKLYYFDERRAAKRDPRQLFALVLHHMAFSRGSHIDRYDCTNSHFAILPDGNILQFHPVSAMLWSSNDLSPRSVAVEFAGNFPDVDGKVYKEKSYGRHSPTQAQIDSGRYLILYLVHVLGIDRVFAHRQSSDQRENDPGPDIWCQVGEWAIANAGIKDTTAEKVGSGAAILPAWRTWCKKKDEVAGATETAPNAIFTVLSAEALLRTAPLALNSTRRNIPQYTQVVILQEKTKDAKAYAEVREASPASSPSLGWTLKSNLEPNVDWAAFKQSLVRTANAELTFWTTPPPVKSETTRTTFDRQRAYWSISGSVPTDAQLGSIDWQDGPMGADRKRSGGHYWSAVFISWCVKQAGAGRHFKYSASHSNYIVAARNHCRNGNTASPFWAYPLNAPEAAWPEPGDLLCKNREGNTYTIDTIAAGDESHCDIVMTLNRLTKQIEVVGGNVDNRVAKRIVALDDMGHISTAGNWTVQGSALSGAQSQFFAVIKVRTGSSCVASAVTQAESLPDYPWEISTQQHPSGIMEPVLPGGEACPNGATKVRKETHNGAVVACQKADGTLHGTYREFFPTGKKWSEGRYENGKSVGLWRTWHENGKIESEMNMANGLAEGSFRQWFNNGQAWQEGDYRNNKPEGKWLVWDTAGGKRSEGMFANGFKVGEWQRWHGNGKTESKGNYDNDAPYGIWIRWHSNGQKQEEGKYAGKMKREFGGRILEVEKREGKWTWWFANGNKQKEGVFINGYEEGTWKFWNEKGALLSSAQFMNGIQADQTGSQNGQRS